MTVILDVLVVIGAINVVSGLLFAALVVASAIVRRRAHPRPGGIRCGCASCTATADADRIEAEAIARATDAKHGEGKP